MGREGNLYLLKGCRSVSSETRSRERETSGGKERTFSPTTRDTVTTPERQNTRPEEELRVEDRVEVSLVQG